MISDYDRDSMAAILAGQGDWFSAHLLRLISRADAYNLAKLRLIFPDHVAAYESWHKGPTLPPFAVISRAEEIDPRD